MLKYFICIGFGTVLGFIVSGLMQACRENQELMDYLDEIAQEGPEMDCAPSTMGEVDHETKH